MTAEDHGRETTGAEDPRLQALDKRLEAHRAAAIGGKARKVQTGYSQGNRVLAQLIGGPAGGALIGWVLDRLFATSPWLLLAMLTLGTVSAFRNIYRISQERPE